MKCDICNEPAKHRHYAAGGQVLDLCDACKDKLLDKRTLVDQMGWTWTWTLRGSPPACVHPSTEIVIGGK